MTLSQRSLKNLAALQHVASDLWRLHPAAAAEEITAGAFKRYRHVEKISRLVAKAVFKGGARIILSTPPRHGKSWLLSQYTPAWFLSLWPMKRVILASYEATFAATWGRNVRNLLVEHPRLGVKISDDSSAADRWTTTAGGGMFTTGIGGPLTGRGGDLLILDDPVKNAEEAASEIVRQKTWDWFLSTFMTRAEPGASVIVIMTRWHEDDVVGRLTAPEYENRDQWTVINLPAICEEPGDFLGRSVGEALCPERYDVTALEQIKREVAFQIWTSLYQGEPTARDGALFMSEMFDFVQIPDTFEYTFVTADTAYDSKKENDYTVFSAWGVKGGELYLVDVFRKQIKAADAELAARQFIGRYQKWGFRGAYIEPKGHGIYLNQTLPAAKMMQVGDKQVKFPGIMIPSDTDRKKFFEDRKLDKVARANNAAPHLAGRRVHINAELADREVLVKEALGFPRAKHDDFVDTLIDAIKYVWGRSFSMFDVQ